MRKNKIICLNAGDSRGILINNKEIIQLSRDHKPELPDEKNRINLFGGVVDKYTNGFYKSGPYRVWVKNEEYPGLAMSRSIGDFVASRIGVICEPEILEYELSKESKYI